ncbi:MAG: hypothetical protein AAF585_06155, partial [Verrucomicrobiota bacterium]
MIAGLAGVVVKKLQSQLTKVEDALIVAKAENEELIARVERLQQREIEQRTFAQSKSEDPEKAVPEPPGRLIFEGEITEVSKLPANLATAPYPSALWLVRVKPVRMFVGTSPNEELIVATWVLWKRQQLPKSKFVVGDLAYFDVEAPNRMPEWQARMARFDTLDYGFSETIWHDSLASQIRQARFASQPERIENNRGFLRELEVLRAGRDASAIDFTYRHKFCVFLSPKGQDGWYIDHPNELFLKATDLFDSPGNSIPSAAAVLDLANYLESRGVEFIFASIPSKAEVYPDKFVPEVPEDIRELVSPARYRFLEFLAKQGVEVIDLAKPLRELRETEAESEYHFFTKGADPHLSFSGSESVAKVFSGRGGVWGGAR